MSTIIADRLKAVEGIKCGTGSHGKPPAHEPPGAFCAMEKFAYITGQRWTDYPDNCSNVIGAFIRRWNDGTDQETRDRLDEWIVDNADRLVRTAGDGHDNARGYLAADWAVRTALPIWLDVSGASEAAATVRGLVPLTDYDSSRAARKITGPIRSQMVKRRDSALESLREQVRAAVAERLKEKVAAGAVWAAGAAWAAEGAEAAGAAEASAAAEAAGAAWAAGAAEAAWAAEAAEAAADSLDADTRYWNVYDAVYAKVRPIFAAKITPLIEEKLGPKAGELKAGAFDVLEQMVALGEVTA
jgi:hypothetical protein